MTTLGGVDHKTGTFRVYMTCLDYGFIDIVKERVPVSDREWDPKNNQWTFAIKHLSTVKKALGYEA